MTGIAASTMKPLLLEIGTEELPVKALPGLAQALFDGVVAGLAKRGITTDAGVGRPLYTPRRLAVLLPAVAVAQAEQRSEVLGPYLDIALDGDGQPTRALQGFAQKAGVDWTALERLTDGRGERFVHRAVRPGVATTELLQDVVHEAVAAMPIPRPMRWGAHEHAFARPVHWLVLLLGGDVVEAALFGIRGDRMSRGHRFMHDKPVWIGNPGDYVDALRAAKVLVDPAERRARILHQVEAAATAAGGVAHVDDDNLAQVNCLVEWPHAVACSFERVFLEVPPEALVETMQANQKFFPVRDASGALSEHFVGVANVAPVDSSEIRRGYERVIRPRFADARFFFVEDLKQGLGSMGEGLASVTYQAKLGTIADKARRVATLAESIAPTLAVEPGLARRAAELSKADLQSRLVNEFPELQGVAGRHYALRDAALADLDDAPRRDVAAAIDEAYMPRFAGDAIAPSPLGRTLAIAERADTLAGGFAAGLKPTGNKDPFALRRTALGLARTIIESGVELDLWLLLGEARLQASQAMGRAAVEAKQAAVARARAGGATVSDSQEAISSTAPADIDELFDFVLERMRGYYEARGFTELQFAAVLARRPRMLHDFDQRLKAVAQFARLPEAEALAAADKRIRNILRKAGNDVPATVDAALLAEAAERDLHDAVEQAIADTDPALATGDYVAVLGRMARLRPQVDAFFDAVMVNVEDVALRGNRLALLQQLSGRLGAVAAIEHLSA